MPIRILDRNPPRERQDVVSDLAACAIALALILLAAAGLSGPARPLLALLFTFYVPGRALVANWPQLARWSPLGMSVVLSLALLTLLAMAALWAGLWQPMPLFYAEAALSLAGLVMALARRHRGLRRAREAQ